MDYLSKDGATHIHTHTQIQNTHTRAHTNTHTHIHTDTHTHIHTDTHKHTYIHAQTHTQISFILTHVDLKIFNVKFLNVHFCEHYIPIHA